MKTFKVLGVIVIALLLLTTALVTPQPARADSPHFIKASAGFTGTLLQVNFKLAGLGNADVTITISGPASATWVCVNGGGHVPSDPKKITVSTTIVQSGIFSPKNGTVNGLFVLAPSGPPSDWSCPSGQRATLQFESFGPLTLESADAKPVTIGPFTQTLFTY